MKTQSIFTSQVNANRKLDELNNLLMSHIDSNGTKCTQNLANLRDVLSAAHKIDNSKINPHESLNLLIEFLKSEQKDSNNNQIVGQHQTDTIISRIENDLQESLKILKQYNEKIEQDRCALEMESCRKSHGVKYERMREEQEKDDDEPCGYSFNRNDVVRKNFFAKSENLGEKLKRLSQISKKNSISEATKRDDEASSRELSRKSSSPSARQINTQRRNSFDHAALLESSKPKTMSKSSTSQFDKINSIGTDLPLLSSGMRHSESGFWKYDELNELKQKFISLLSDSNKQATKNYKQSH
ncbi:hypothetical protein BpHYR1_029529 [Brachionus plicatilis]|uniref:Uncharacterized protein n=1 Tax=Brachionus plicatilis TaxID=10195 RepID=A0A3M7P0Q3_BRAPC|nr:hypothetical protein BpHYR1_029529 [Brachionus plicatilis]